MGASHCFGRGMGTRKLKLVIEKYPEIMSVDWNKDKMISKIKDVDGFSDVTASQFTDNYEEFKTFFEEINKVINIKHLKNNSEKKDGKDVKDANGTFKDQVVVFTGFRSKEAEQLIEKQGGRVSGTVSGNTTLLVHSAGDTSSSKYQKAKKLDIKTMTGDEFMEKYMKDSK